MHSAAPPPSRCLAVGTAEHYRWLDGIVRCVLVLNLLDAIFTLWWVRWGLALEANLMIDRLIDDAPLVFVAVKLGLVGMGSWLLWRHRERGAAVVAIFVAFLAYYLILLYHLQYASHVVRQLIGGA